MNTASAKDATGYVLFRPGPLQALHVLRTGNCSVLRTDYVRVHRQSPIVVSPWTGNPLSLLNAVLAVPATSDVDCVKFCNVACILHVYKVEVCPGVRAGGEYTRETPRYRNTLVTWETPFHAVDSSRSRDVDTPP